jgi:hypothetical protein
MRRSMRQGQENKGSKRKGQENERKYKEMARE